MKFQILFYKDKQGNQPVKDYILKLSDHKNKNNRIKLNKIEYYLEILSTYGTSAGEPYVKHITGDLWELRPVRDRIFFFCWEGESFVLLHQFVKQSQKTPLREIEQARQNMKDYIERSKHHE